MNQRWTIAAMTVALVAVNAQAADSRLSEFNETVMVCTNLDMYPVMAARNRDAGMPLDTARSLVVASMEKNFESKLPPGVLQPTIDVVKEIYGRIYADSDASPESFASIVFDACSGYRGYSIDKVALKAALSDYVQSAFNPLARVPYASKLVSPLQTLLRAATGA